MNFFYMSFHSSKGEQKGILGPVFFLHFAEAGWKEGRLNSHQ